MSDISILYIAHSYRYLSPPLTLSEMFGETFLRDREEYSLKEWLRFDWVPAQPSEYVFRMISHVMEKESEVAALKATWEILQACATQLNVQHAAMNHEEKFHVRAMLSQALGLKPSDLTFPSEQLDLGLGISIPPISVDGVLKVPDIPKIPGISVSDVIPPINSGELLDTIQEKAEGVTAGLFESIKQLVVGIHRQVLYVLDKFVDRMSNVVSLLKDGVLDQAFGELIHALVYFATDSTLASSALVVNYIYDTLAATVLCLYFGRKFTRAERDFAHSIFGDQINVTNVRIVNHLGWDRALVAANVIYMKDLDLTDSDNVHTFAHELTHIYQDQHVVDMPATGTATREQLGHMFSTHGSPYNYELNHNTTWQSLRVEAQAQLVADYQVQEVDGSEDRDPLATAASVAIAERILEERRLFRWR